MTKLDPKRAKLLGELIRNARLHSRRAIPDVATILDIDEASYKQIEAGEKMVSLPDLEVLAIFFKVPMGYFWGSTELEDTAFADYTDFLALRHRVVGLMVRQKRLRARKSLADMAQTLGVDEDVVKQYESGSGTIPFLHLEQMARFLGVPITFFVDDEHGPLARHEAEQNLLKIFAQMSTDMQVFLTNPTNASYLETAHRISQMDVERLRDVAAGILDITL